jgi:hypothetical protein
LLSYVYGRIHSTGGNFCILETAMWNKNKNNKRFIISDKMYYYTVSEGEKKDK